MATAYIYKHNYIEPNALCREQNDKVSFSPNCRATQSCLLFSRREIYSIMNPISLTVWTLENNCYLVYATLTVCFVAFTLYHRVSSGVQRNESGGQSGKLAGNAGSREPDYSDDQDYDPDLTPAISEDTPHIPYQPVLRSDEEVLARSREYYELMAKRRTVRAFSQDEIPQEVLENIVKTAGTAPSGAHTEPWSFVLVQDATTKAAIREIVEEEEELNYNKRMSRQWVTDLKPFATKAVKPYLTEAPALLLVFRQTHATRSDGKKRMHYYSEISVAIAAGFILAAVQYCGLVALTSTPLNCSSRLRALLLRPANERLELLLPLGRPHQDALVPDLKRKQLDEILVKI